MTNEERLKQEHKEYAMPKEDLCRLIGLLCDIDGIYYLGKDKSDVIGKAVDIATEVLEAEYGKW